MKRVMKSALLALVLISATVAASACGGESTAQTGQVDAGTTPPVNSTNEQQQQPTPPPQLPEPSPEPELNNPLLGRWRADQGNLTLVFAADGTGTSIDGRGEDNFLWSTDDGRIMITSLLEEEWDYFIEELSVEHLFFEADRIPSAFERVDGDSGIIGNWSSSSSGWRNLEFRADGSGERYIVNNQGSGSTTESFMWYAWDGNITMDFEGWLGFPNAMGQRAHNQGIPVYGTYFMTSALLRFGWSAPSTGIFGKLNSEDNSLVGTWASATMRFVFNADGTGLRINSSDERELLWSAENGLITVTTIYAEQPADFTISDTTLTIFEEGANTFTRVGDGR